ncbi:MAG: phosphonate ABC transporter, permease protein PhnE [Bacillota bacterium]
MLKRMIRHLTLILFLLLLVSWSFSYTKFQPAAFQEAGNLKNMQAFLLGLWPPDFSPEFLRTVGKLLLETLAISTAGTALAIMGAIPLTILATPPRGEELSRVAQGTLPWLLRWGLYYLSRSLLNLCRAVPELLWALIFITAVGLGPFPGVLALATHSLGILGKLYAEILEATDQRLVDTVRATGASELAVLLYARIPVNLPVLLSYTLFRWECNMRAATVLGFVGAGGIGTQLTLSMQLFAYHEVATLVLVILLLVLGLDLLGQFIRNSLLNQPITCKDELE